MTRWTSAQNYIICRLFSYLHLTSSWQSIPRSPKGQLDIALIEQTWENDTPVKTTSTAVHAIPMSDIEAMRKSIHDLYSLVAQERLRNDANSQESSAKLGVFVDPFFDDDMRDQGMEQTAALFKILDQDVGITDGLIAVWDAETQALFAAVMSFWFGQRALAKFRSNP